MTSLRRSGPGGRASGSPEKRALIVIRLAIVASYVWTCVGCATHPQSLRITDTLSQGTPRGYVEFYVASRYIPGGAIHIGDLRLLEAVDSPGEFVKLSKVVYSGTLTSGRERVAYPPGSYSFVLHVPSYGPSWKRVVHVVVREGEVTPVRMEFQAISRVKSGSTITHRFNSVVTVEEPLPVAQHQLRIERQNGKVTQSNGSASFQSKMVRLGNKSVMVMARRADSNEDKAKDTDMMLAVASMEAQCVREGHGTMSRNEYEQRVRAILDERGAGSVVLLYADDSTMRTVTADRAVGTGVNHGIPFVQHGKSNSMTLPEAARVGDCDQILKNLKQGANVEEMVSQDPASDVPILRQHLVTPLMLAAKGSHLDAVKLLIANGANVNSSDQYGSTALDFALGAQPYKDTTWSRDQMGNLNDVTIAASRGNPAYLDTLRYLLEHGSDVSAADKEGRSPIIRKLGHQFAGKENLNVEVVSLLAGHGASVNARDKVGTTPLLAILSEFRVSEPAIEMVTFLLHQGADVNASDNKGVTPLMRAASARWGEAREYDSRKTLEMMKLLVEHGANVNAVDKKGHSALWRAERLNLLKDVAAFLRNSAAKGG